jgi:hypothetical protein
MRIVRPRHSVAVIFPLHDHRGFGLKALRAWQQQRDAVSKCEFIVVGSGQRGLERLIQQHLGTSDTFVRCQTLNEASLYNAGAAVATAEWLLFTESHVLPTANTLSMLATRLENDDVDAAVLGSRHEIRSRFSQVDAALCEREQAGPMRAMGLWRCVGLRGFLVRRDLFEKLGRFQERYFRFAETVFALRLVVAKHRLVEFQDVVVRHVDSDSISEIWFAMKMGRLGACRFHEDEPELAAAGFGCAAPPRSLCSTTPAQAHRLWRQVFRVLRDGHLTLALQLLRLALPTASTAIGGWWAVWLAASLRAAGTHLMFLAMLYGRRRGVPATDMALIEGYALLRQRCAEVGAVLYEQEAEQRLESHPERVVEALQATDLHRHGIGFFPPEAWHGEAYCWSRPQAAIRLARPSGPSVIRLDIRPTGRWTPRRPQLSLDGRLLPAEAVVEHDGWLDVHVGESDSGQREMMLSWKCRPFRPARAGLADARSLGLAVISVTTMAASQREPREISRTAA